MSEAQKSPSSDQTGARPSFTGFPPHAEETPRPLTVLHQQFSSGARTRWHSHHRPELLHATGGLLVLTTEQGAWTAPAGHALIIAPNVPHELAAYGCTEMRAAFLSGEALAMSPVIGTSAATQCRVIGVSELLDVCLRRLADGPLLYDVDGRGGHLAALAIEEIRRAPEMRIALPLPRSARLRQLGRELIQNPALGFDLDGWSEKVGVSRSTFTRRFRAETGLSFAEWRRRLRLLHALTLRAGGAPLHDAAKLTGYRSTNALRDMMRRAMADTMSTTTALHADLRHEPSH